MMISPDLFVEKLKESSYKDLIQQRKRLIREIERFEELEMKDDRSGDEWMIKPSPDVQLVLIRKINMNTDSSRE